MIYLSVFNFWEPLHYLDRGHGFQTWETSPEYAIRSYAYVALHLAPVKISRLLFGDQKVGRVDHAGPPLNISIIEGRLLRPPWNSFACVDPL